MTVEKKCKFVKPVVSDHKRENNRTKDNKLKMNDWNFQKMKFHFSPCTKVSCRWQQQHYELSATNRCQRKWNDFSTFTDKNRRLYLHTCTENLTESVEVCQWTYAAVCLIQVLLLPVLLSLYYFFLHFSFQIQGIFIDFHKYAFLRFHSNRSFILTKSNIQWKRMLLCFTHTHTHEMQ